MIDVQTYTTYDEFVREWDAPESDTRMLWQLLGQLEPDELLVEIPEWLAAEKVGFADGATPTLFVGRIGRETDKAVRFVDSAAARSLMKLAHRIHELEQDEANPDRNAWLDRRLETHRAEFEEREGVPALSDEWLPKSQILRAARR